MPLSHELSPRQAALEALKYDALRNVSPLLASRSGLSTADDKMAEVAAKIAELVAQRPA